MKKVSVYGILFVFVFSALGVAKSFMEVDALEFRNRHVLVYDLLEFGEPQLIVGGQGRVEIWLQGELVTSIDDFQGNVHSLAVGDMTGDFRLELLVGTDHAGAFYVYERQQNRYVRNMVPKYLWSTVTALLPLDITGDGWRDVLALTEEGTAVLFRSFEGELHVVWQSMPNQRVVSIAAADITRDGKEEALYVWDSGYVGVLQWREGAIRVLWEDYPWGSVKGAMIHFGEGGPELLYVTGQNNLHGWVYEGESMVLKRQFATPELGLRFHYLESSSFIVDFSREGGLMLYSLGNQGLVKKGEVPYIRGESLQVYGDALLIAKGNREYSWIYEVEEDHFVYVFNGEILEEPLGLLKRNQEWMLSWECLGALVFHETFELAKPVVGRPEILWKDELVLPLSLAVWESQGVVYVPLEATMVFGLEAFVDLARRRFELNPVWGWY